MHWFTQVVGSATADTTPSIVVHFNSQRYLFNCGEGTQRLFVQNGVRANKVSNVFFTRLHWEVLGGMPGFLLTLADVGVTRLSFHGGQHLMRFMACSRHYIARAALTVEINEFNQEKAAETFYQDENLTVQAVELLPTLDMDAAEQRPPFKRRCSAANSSSDEEIAVDSNDPESHEQMLQRILSTMFPNIDKQQAMAGVENAEAVLEDTRATDSALRAVHSRQLFQNRALMTRRLPRVEASPAVLCYIARGHEVSGRFDPKAALALGLRPGPIFGKLKNGATITLEDGTVIEPQQVVGPSHPGAAFAVIDCPSLAYLPALLASPALTAFQQERGNRAPKCVFYLLGENGLAQHPDLQAWMRGFAPSTQHIIAASELTANSIQFRSAAECQVRLAKLDKHIFPIPYYNERPALTLEQAFPKMKNAHVASTGLQFVMEPKAALITSELIPPQDYTLNGPFSKAIDEDPAQSNAIEEARAQIAAHTTDSEDVDSTGADDIQVITLGTGSAMPSKYRNVSANVLLVPEVGTFILDAGEGTYGQLWRHFGDDETHGMTADECLRQLRFMFISHLHADHHLGAVRLLLRWQALRKKDRRAMEQADQPPLYLVAPRRFWTWLNEYSDIEPLPIADIRYINAANLGGRKVEAAFVRNFIKKMHTDLGMEEIATADVIHCPMSYGISLKHRSGWKIVYSGDTRPCDALVKVGRDATLLIHEATLEDDMQQEAIEKRHSTISEALEIGRRMCARSVLLTHFSQRYPRVPPLNSIVKRTGFAFDLMRIRIGDLWKMPFMLPALRVLVAVKEDEEAAEEEKETTTMTDSSKASS